MMFRLLYPVRPAPDAARRRVQLHLERLRRTLARAMHREMYGPYRQGEVHREGDGEVRLAVCGDEDFADEGAREGGVGSGVHVVDVDAAGG